MENKELLDYYNRFIEICEIADKRIDALANVVTLQKIRIDILEKEIERLKNGK
jgi:hypothetical protein